MSEAAAGASIFALTYLPVAGQKLDRRQKIRVAKKVGPLCHRCLEQCKESPANKLADWHIVEASDRAAIGEGPIVPQDRNSAHSFRPTAQTRARSRVLHSDDRRRRRDAADRLSRPPAREN
jgi:hypothetical protein